jgi:N6-adenosine-specific RNA methylase IME4
MIPFPNKKYNIIYADPAWNYTTFSNKIPQRAKSGQKYNAMRMVDIYDLPVNKISNENAILFMWATSALLPEAIYTIKAWGFDFKTVGFVWIKKNKKQTDTNFWGMGKYTRANAEYCLIGTKGNIKAISHGVHSVIETPIEAHSKKPDIVRDKIVELMGDLPRIELFARQKADGWDSWGNEV